MKLASWFETVAVDGKGHFVRLRDGAPEWLDTAVYEAHRSVLPHDWIFEQCLAIANAIDEGSVQDEEDLHMHVDTEVEVYTKPLMQWVADFCTSTLYSEAEDAARDCESLSGTLVEQARSIQYFAIDIIARTIFQAWRDNAAPESEPASSEDA